MSEEERKAPGTRRRPAAVSPSRLLRQYGCGPIPFAGTGNAFYERHLVFDNVVGLSGGGPARDSRPRHAPSGTSFAKDG